MFPTYAPVQKSKVVKMKASIYTQYGSPDVLQIKEIPIPKLKDDELLIKVKATTVNLSLIHI